MSVTLFDNASRFKSKNGREGTCWSPNVWKTRLYLNFKGIPYETQWLDLPEIAPLYKSLDIKPHPKGYQMAPYTIPGLRLPDGTCVQESWRIAQSLEPLYPSPSAHLDAPVLKRVERAWRKAIGPLVPVLVPRMPDLCLKGVSIAFHRKVRKESYGMELEELERQYGGEKAWEKAMPGLKALAAALKEDPAGPYCLGKTPSYADFLIVGFLEWAKCVSTEDDLYDRIVGVDRGFDDVYKACSPWLERNDH